MDFKMFTGDFGKSKEQIKEEMAEFEKAIFPFGEQHKQKVKDLLFQIFSKKLYQIDIMIGFIEGKKSYLKDQNLTAVYKLIKAKKVKLSNEQIMEILALIVLDTQCDSIEKLPQLEQVRSYAKSINLTE
jgi:hypothetical protein